MERLPDSIDIGTRVFDSERHEIGKVDGLKYPENATAPDIEPATVDAADTPEDNTIIGAMAEAFGREDIPEPLRSQLLRDGYIHLDARGLFARDRYILPEQIARVDADGIQLNVTRDALIKRPH
ncbi:MAG: hypothetical protein J0I48_10815 [Devosia sp.]|uniref:hypothetical protein n=1 Tax=Devosia sp. 66-22 TaxID=1895753 RepID=UPI00092B2458|nr:hypothetical protein [Devosia sp. 66-22]MBN9346672.1 hypothetical protein [Devosia sp.]OJX46353.1 MAG: hypothetical protein BGO81_02995 [Devosia sp. 66-22]